MTEGVGKRIVDALKKQAEVELVKQEIAEEPSMEQPSFVQEPISNEVPFVQESAFNPNAFQNNYINQSIQPTVQPTVQPSVQSSMQNNVYSQPLVSSYTDFSGLDVPPNVAVLRQLISQLPSGVSRQAGALVIKQTMEALGISMKSVLQEAQQVQENINVSARDCQNTILECKKQINTLEAQVQKYQKQSAALNDIVSLFLQIN